MSIKMYKGFDKDLKCRGFQYEIGETYREESADLCKKGFHACENPLDIFNYYSPKDGSRFCEVELDEVSEQKDCSDSKRCGKVIKIGAELDIAGLCKAHFEYVTAKCDPVKTNAAGDGEAASAGSWGSASAGESGSASAGENGIACCRGGKVKGGLGCAICCAEVDGYGNNIGIAAAIVDGDKIKADTWYTVKNGQFVEVE